MLKVYHGEESFLSLKQAKLDIDKHLSDCSDCTVKTINCDTLTSEQVISDLSTDNMFVSKQVYFLKRPYENKDKTNFIDKLIEILSKNDKEIFVWIPGKLNRSTKLYKLAEKMKSVVEFAKLNKPAFYKLCNHIFSKEEIDISNDDIKNLSERVNYSVEALYTELEKIKLGELKTVTTEYILTNIGDTFEEKIWDLTDYINAKDEINALSIYKNLFKQDIPVQLLIGVIAKNYRTILLTKYVSEIKKNTQSIASELRIPPFLVHKIISDAKIITFEKLKKNYEMIAEYDYKIKNGQLSESISIPLLIHNLIN